MTQTASSAPPRPRGWVQKACVAMGVLAATALLLNVLWEVAMGLRALSWPTASGRIVAAGVERGDCRTGKAEPDIRYQFRVGNRDVEVSHASFMRHTCVSQSALKAWVTAMPVGTVVTVRHHPEDPREAVLVGEELSPATAVKAGMAALVWAGLIAAAVQARQRQRQAQRQPRRLNKRKR